MAGYGYTTALCLSGTRDSYELRNFSFSLAQPIDCRGKAEGEVVAGVLDMTYENLPSNELSGWMLNPRNYRDGSVKVYGENGSLIQEVAFKKATCIGMDVRYMESGSGYCITHLVVQAYSVTVESMLIENNWKNIMP